jgi:glycosyltransferase involved in cell wall biosynthesis
MRGAYLGCSYAVNRKLREINPDVVHAQGTERYCAIAAARSKFPKVLTIHGNMRRLAQLHKARPFSYFWLAARLEAFTLPRFDGVICISAHTESQVLDLARATWLIPNAVRPDFFRPIPSGARALPPLILNIGLISPNKRQNDVLDLALELHHRGAVFQFGFVGKVDQTSAYGREFQQKIDALTALGCVKYFGEKSMQEVIALMDTASALIHFSMEESYCLVVAEALARNLKFFGADVGGVRAVAQDVDGAELFEAANRDKVADAIERWLKAGSPRPDTASAEIWRRCQPDGIARKHLEVYSLLAKSTQGKSAAAAAAANSTMNS